MSSAARRTLVTGGAGFLGSALVKALVDAGRPVRVLDNSFRGSRERLGEYLERVEFVEGDVRDRQTVDRALRDVQVCCHLAAINGTRFFYEIPDQVLSVGVLGTLNTLEACREQGVEEYFFASSSEAYQTPQTIPTPEDTILYAPDPFNPRYSYGGSKLIGELLAFNYGRGYFKTVVFRPHNVYGPAMGFEHVIPEFVMRLRDATRGVECVGAVPFPIQGSGDETRAFCHVRDFTRGLMRVLDQGEDQSVYHIGNDDEVSIRHLAAVVGRAMGFDLELQSTPAPVGGTPRRCPDISKLRALGYAPRLRLTDGLADTIAWYTAEADRRAGRVSGWPTGQSTQDGRSRAPDERPSTASRSRDAKSGNRSTSS